MRSEEDAFTSLGDQFSGVPDAVRAASETDIKAFREELSGPRPEPDRAVMDVVRQLYSAPMERLSQHELAETLGLEPTQALRDFKWNTGLTFRKFKIWAASIATVRGVLAGQTIGAAGIDTGFSDAAHVARTAQMIFGVTPRMGIGRLTDLVPV